MANIKTLHTSLLISILSISSPFVYADDDDERKICGEVKPILSVADVNATGIVDADDIGLITSAKKEEQYIALYDFNTNGKIDGEDVNIAKSQLGQSSQKIDQQLALLYNRNKQSQFIKSAADFTAIGYYGIPKSYVGHGRHWEDQVSPIEGDYLRPKGLNASPDNQVSAVYWGINATPVFEFGATDYPTPGGEWETQRVVSLLEPAPKFFDSPDEKWHAHGGACLTKDNGEFQPNQFVTYAECQSKPSTVKDPVTGKNVWMNIYMLHTWIFDLNPNGIFANTHPCIDPNGLPVDSVNGDREVPPFFHH